MTVAELIALLETMPGSAPVVMIGSEFDLSVAGVEDHRMQRARAPYTAARPLPETVVCLLPDVGGPAWKDAQ